jgi:hypothetical protein
MARGSQTPPVVVVLEDADFERLDFEPSGSELLLRSDIAVLAYPSADRTELVEMLEQHGLWRPGIRAVQSPYTPTRYASVENARDVFALEKHFMLTSLCAHLGAITVSVEQVQIKSSRGSDTLDLTANHPGGLAASARYHKELAAHLEGRLRLHDRFDGGEPDLARAHQLLREKRLAEDPGLWSLIESRSAVNRLRERTLEISLTDDAERTIEMAAGLSIPIYGALGARWKSEVVERIEYRLKYRIMF